MKPQDELYGYNYRDFVTTILAYTDLRSSVIDRTDRAELRLMVEKALQRRIAQLCVGEFNNSYTRSLVFSFIDDALKEAKGKNRLIYDFAVRCNETNNPPEVIERNALRADLYMTYRGSTEIEPFFLEVNPQNERTFEDIYEQSRTIGSDGTP